MLATPTVEKELINNAKTPLIPIFSLQSFENLLRLKLKFSFKCRLGTGPLSMSRPTFDTLNFDFFCGIFSLPLFALRKQDCAARQNYPLPKKYPSHRSFKNVFRRKCLMPFSCRISGCSRRNRQQVFPFLCESSNFFVFACEVAENV